MDVVKDLNDRLMQEVIKNEEQIESLRNGNADAEKHEFNREHFAFSKHTNSACIEFLNDNDIELDTWIGDADDNDKVKNILKIWFTLNRSYNKEDWCQFPRILDTETFYSNAKEVLTKEAPMLGKQTLFVN